MAIHPNSLANLKPAKRGEVRNPRGVNGYTRDAARNVRFQAVCYALEFAEFVREVRVTRLGASQLPFSLLDRSDQERSQIR